MRIFPDTNVLVSAFATRGLCADLFRAILAREELIVGEVVLDELERVLRTKLGAPESLVAEILDLLRRHTVVQRPAAPHPDDIRDPDDAWVLASALAGEADILVTGDRDLLVLDPPAGLEILDPRGLWTRLGSEEE